MDITNSDLSKMHQSISLQARWPNGKAPDFGGFEDLLKSRLSLEIMRSSRMWVDFMFTGMGLFFFLLSFLSRGVVDTIREG